MTVKVGDSLPENTKFSYVPYRDENSGITACGIPVNYDANKEWAGKKVVLFAVPGAFTPGCQNKHLPGYISKLDQLKSAGVDIVACVAFNDAFVMSAWGKANNVKDEILFLNDPKIEFSTKIGYTLGERTGRYALIIDNLKITYADMDSGPGVVEKSAVDAVLSKL